MRSCECTPILSAESVLQVVHTQGGAHTPLRLAACMAQGQPTLLRPRLSWPYVCLVVVMLAGLGSTSAARTLLGSALAPDTGFALNVPAGSGNTFANSSAATGLGLEGAGAAVDSAAPLSHSAVAPAPVTALASASEGTGVAALAADPAAADIQPLVLAQRRYSRPPPSAQAAQVVPGADAAAKAGAGAAGAAQPASDAALNQGASEPPGSAVLSPRLAAAGAQSGAAAASAPLSADSAAAGFAVPQAAAASAAAASAPSQTSSTGSTVAGITARLSDSTPQQLPVAGPATAAAPPAAAGGRTLPAVQSGADQQAAVGAGVPGAAGSTAAAPAAAVPGTFTTGAVPTGTDTGTNQTVTLLAPRDGGGHSEGQVVAVANHTGRASAQHPNVGLPGGAYSQPQMGRMSSSQLAALEVRS